MLSQRRSYPNTIELAHIGPSGRPGSPLAIETPGPWTRPGFTRTPNGYAIFRFGRPFSLSKGPMEPSAITLSLASCE